jgi:methyltransferase (TIGR00027 family)
MESEASQTAVLVCKGRAVADGRLGVGRFSDPIARELLTAAELEEVDLARAGVPPKGMAARMGYEMLIGNAEVMAPRTVAIDDGVRGRPNAQVVVLGAGLDSRAWRMTELAESQVFEVDHPASQADKQSRVGSLPPAARAVHFVPVDFARDSLDAALARAGHESAVRTTWVWEGVVPYLTREEVIATMRVIGRRSPEGSRLIVNYQAPSPTASVGRIFARSMSVLAKRGDPLAHEPRRSHWSDADMRDLMLRHEWFPTTDEGLLDVADRLGLKLRHRKSVAPGRVMIVDR